MAEDDADFSYSGYCKRNRSAATLLLTWIRFELQGRLRRCPLFGLALFFRQANWRTMKSKRHPLAAS